MEKGFYVVWNPTHGNPRYRHMRFDAAKTEAERLAKNHPTQEFYVLKAMSLSKKIEITTERLQAEDDHDLDSEIPF